MIEDLVILVNEKDEQIGSIGKLEAHQKGLLHRAFSIIVWNDQNEILIHQRAAGKYHSEGLWTNACCSHPKVGESVLEAAHRRLQEEMGFD
jgi:isopentenyl-diphosphate delta-isomerase